MIAFVYVVGVGFIWRTQVALDVASWYGVPVDGKLQPSLAGWWLGCVSLPLFQFLLLRWYFRLFIWARFLWQVSRIELKLRADASGPLRRRWAFWRWSATRSRRCCSPRARCSPG